eukprot:3759322-Prymnesium_polylepis.1
MGIAAAGHAALDHSAVQSVGTSRKGWNTPGMFGKVHSSAHTVPEFTAVQTPPHQTWPRSSAQLCAVPAQFQQFGAVWRSSARFLWCRAGLH